MGALDAAARRERARVVATAAAGTAAWAVALAAMAIAAVAAAVLEDVAGSWVVARSVAWMEVRGVLVALVVKPEVRGASVERHVRG